MFSKIKKGKAAVVAVTALAVVGAVVFVSGRAAGSDRVDEKILFVSTHNGTISESDKKELTRESLEQRLQEGINLMDGIKSSTVMLDDEHAAVELVLSSETDFSEDMENDVKDFVRRSSSVEEMEVVVTVVADGE